MTEAEKLNDILRLVKEHKSEHTKINTSNTYSWKTELKFTAEDDYLIYLLKRIRDESPVQCNGDSYDEHVFPIYSYELEKFLNEGGFVSMEEDDNDDEEYQKIAKENIVLTNKNLRLNNSLMIYKWLTIFTTFVIVALSIYINFFN